MLCCQFDCPPPLWMLFTLLELFTKVLLLLITTALLWPQPQPQQGPPAIAAPHIMPILKEKNIAPGGGGGG